MMRIYATFDEWLDGEYMDKNLRALLQAVSRIVFGLNSC